MKAKCLYKVSLLLNLIHTNIALVTSFHCKKIAKKKKSEESNVLFKFQHKYRFRERKGERDTHRDRERERDRQRLRDREDIERKRKGVKKRQTGCQKEKGLKIVIQDSGNIEKLETNFKAPLVTTLKSSSYLIPQDWGSESKQISDKSHLNKCCFSEGYHLPMTLVPL